jgi:hypothetical protein
VFSKLGAALRYAAIPFSNKLLRFEGVGKSKINDMDHWKDMLSVLAMSKEYFVTEPYIPWKADVRVQKIGNHYRAIERVRMR